MQALNAVPANGQTFSATSLPQVITELSEQIKQPLYLTKFGDMAALHSYPGLVDITWVSGDSLKSAVSNVVKSYGWNWSDANWLALDDYGFLTPYSIVTPKGDIAHALAQMLEGYPVEAQLLYGTEQVFIQEKQ